MPRLVAVTAAAVGIALLPTGTAAADQDSTGIPLPEAGGSEPAHRAPLSGYITIGGFIGPHLFSSSSTLGAVNTDGPSLESGLALGPRLGYALSPSLTLETGLAAIATQARDGDREVSVTVLEPHAHARLGGGTVAGIEPFALVGLGLPIALSSDSEVIKSGVAPSFQAGVGFAIERASGLVLRFDARALTLPARGVALATFEFNLLLSLEYRFGRRAPPAAAPTPRRIQDADRDGVPDDLDRCPQRDEDRDGFEDEDGCPDIDDDLDQVLDVADQCRLAPETVNGYRDQDGCPDSLPEALLDLDRGELRFRSGRDTLRPQAQTIIADIADILARYRDVKIRIVGHADGDEASADDATAEALSQRRAEAVRDALVARGVAPQRLTLEAAGTRQPASDERDRRARARNRRVTLAVQAPAR